MAIEKEIDDTFHNVKNCSDKKKRMLLRTKEEQLRRKEEQLRKQLRKKEKDLRWEKQRFYELEHRKKTASELKTHHSKLCDC